MPSTPASGAACSLTVTVELALVQGAVPVTVYTYAPGSIAAGSYMPPATTLGPLHVPPASGVPPKAANSEAEAPFPQRSSVPSTPASGAACSVTVTVAEAAAHPPPAGTV